MRVYLDNDGKFYQIEEIYIDGDIIEIEREAEDEYLNLRQLYQKEKDDILFMRYQICYVGNNETLINIFTKYKEDCNKLGNGEEPIYNIKFKQKWNENKTIIER